MQKTTSQKALKVISIIMIVFAALTLLLGTGGIELHAPTFTFPEEILDKGEALLCGLV